MIDRRYVVEEARVILVPQLLAGILSWAPNRHTHFLTNLFPPVADLTLIEADPRQYQDHPEELDAAVCYLIALEKLPLVKGHIYMARINPVI